MPLARGLQLSQVGEQRRTLFGYERSIEMHAVGGAAAQHQVAAGEPHTGRAIGRREPWHEGEQHGCDDSLPPAKFR